MTRPHLLGPVLKCPSGRGLPSPRTCCCPPLSTDPPDSPVRVRSPLPGGKGLGLCCPFPHRRTGHLEAPSLHVSGAFLPGDRPPLVTPGPQCVWDELPCCACTGAQGLSGVWLCDPVGCACQAPRPRDSPGSNTGVGCRSLLHPWLWVPGISLVSAQNVGEVAWQPLLPGLSTEGGTGHTPRVLWVYKPGQSREVVRAHLGFLMPVPRIKRGGPLQAVPGRMGGAA